MKVDFILKTIWKLFENLQSNTALVESVARRQLIPAIHSAK